MLGPHAGYMYSGAVLGETYAHVRVPDRVILLCPNHTGRGVRKSIWSGGAWEMPGGELPIADDLRSRLVELAQLEPDLEAHLSEHAIEVHLPFVLAQNPDAQIVPVVLAGLSLAECEQVGAGLATAVRDSQGQGHDVLIVASTDMSHYISAELAGRLDRLALDRVCALDPAGLYETVRTHEISMCGFIPTTCALYAALSLGAATAELVRYTHSGEVSGDHSRVVGYAGVTIRG